MGLTPNQIPTRDGRAAATFVITNVFALLNKRGLSVTESPISAENLGKLIDLIADDTISGRIAKEVFEIMAETGGDPEAIVEAKGLRQITEGAPADVFVSADLANMAKVTDAGASVGDPVVFAGHASGGHSVVREGTVHLFADGATYGVDGPVMLVDGVSTVGFSGGPVLDLNGQVVGVLQGYEPNLRLTIAITVSAWFSV